MLPLFKKGKIFKFWLKKGVMMFWKYHAKRPWKKCALILVLKWAWVWRYLESWSLSLLSTRVSVSKSRKTFLGTVDSILGDPRAVSQAGLKGSTKVFKHGRKSPWVPTLTGPFPNGQENACSCSDTKNALYYCAQSANSISWFLFVSSYTTAMRDL